MYKKQNKYILVIIVLIVVLYIISFIKIVFNQNTNATSITNISIYRIEDSISKNITSRQILRKDNIVFVGYSKKEIENGYYDLKITLEDRGLKVYINKLWKEFNESLYEEVYVDQITNSIFDIFEYNEETQKELLANHIIQVYLNSKGVTQEIYDKSLNIGKININTKIVNSELVLTIYKEVDNEK